MSRRLFVVSALVISAQAVHGHAQTTDALQCHPQGRPVRVAELSEASGVAASRRNPGILWSLNDSGQPVIYALDASSAIVGRLHLSGAMVDDWEAIAAAPCPGGSCLYIADIGDNGGTRKDVTLYRVSEPDAKGESTAAPEIFHATYPDGAHDAESLFALPDGSLFIVTKGVKDTVALYRFPPALRSGSSVQLQRVAKPREAAKSPNSDRITDAAASSQGDWIVLRTNRALTFHRTKELMAGNWRPASVVDLADLDEPQGEGVTFGADGTIVVVGEGGGHSAPGTLTRLSCSPLR